jgi:multiple sugar transport system substrate-binding protein
MKMRLLSGAAALAVSALLAGCATSSGGGDNSSESSSPSSGQKVTLRFQSLAFQGPTVAASKKIVDDWNKANPNIQVQYVQGSWDSVHDQLVTQFQGGTAPDIIHDESADISQFAHQGYLADLTAYLSSETKSSVSDGIWKTVTVDGKIVAAPTLLQSYVVFANTKLLRKAGISMPSGDTWSWDDFAAAAKKATTSGHPGLGWGLKQPTATVMSLGLNFNGTYFTVNGDSASIKITDNEMQVPKRIHDMAYADKSLDTTSLTQSGSDVMTAFMAGKYAMTVGGNYSAQQLKQEAPKGFSWAVMPPLAGDTAAQAANPQTLSVSAQSKHVKEAAQFVDYVMKPANLAKLAEGDWLIPTSQAARDQVASDTGGKDGWDRTLASGETLTQAPFQQVENYPQWKDQIATPALQQYFGNKISLDELRSKLTDGWKQVGGS